MNKKRVLEEELADLEGKLHRAEKLVTGLAGERVRWESSIRTYESALAALPGDTVVAAAFLSYAGPFPSEYRDELVERTWLPQVGGGGTRQKQLFLETCCCYAVVLEPAQRTGKACKLAEAT